MQQAKQRPLADSIKKILTIGASALVFNTMSAQAETYINPNEMWLTVGEKIRICGIDFDHDGDIDLFNYYKDVITLHKNIGSPSLPKFAPEKAFITRSNILGIETLGLNTGLCSGSWTGGLTQTEVDIDSDGDLDLFKKNKTGGRVDYYENTGTKEHPIYAETPSKNTMGLSSDEWLPFFVFIFVDIDSDGDMDFFHQSVSLAKHSVEELIFYENKGSSAQAQFVKQDKNPVESICFENKLDYFVDLNNDNQVDIVCLEGTVALSNGSGYTITHDLLQAPTQASLRYSHILQATDVDQDGDIDIVGLSQGLIDTDIFGNALNKTYMVSNLSEVLTPQFEIKHIVLNQMDLKEAIRAEFSYADLNGDNALDIIFLENEVINYVVNTGSSSQPQYDFKRGGKTTVFKQCSIEKGAKAFLSFTDIDDDGDLDLFANVSPSFGTGSSVVYCENTGNRTSPLFLSSAHNPLGADYFVASMFGDLDGDGDQDFMSASSRLYDNIGTARQPLFQSTSYTPIVANWNSTWVDMDNDGRVDSVLDHVNRTTQRFGGEFEGQSRLFYNSLEPAMGFAVATEHDFSQMVIAVNRPSQVQLYSCNIGGGCRSEILPFTAKEVSVVTGTFSKEAGDQIALATVDKAGLINVNIYNNPRANGDDFELISHGKGGKAHSISIAAGQLDDDPRNEIVVAFVQEDGTILAAAINDDMSVIGAVQVGKGKHPSVAVGNFSANGGSYVLSYISPDNQLKIATFQANGTLISQGESSPASYAKVSKAEFLPENAKDEYVVSTRQENGVVGLVGFASDGSVLGQLTGGVAQQPTVMSGDLGHNIGHGLVASVIQADKKPAIIFLNNKGEYLATGVGSHKATAATAVIRYYWDYSVSPTQKEKVFTGVLIYLDESGIPRWEVFGTDGVRK